MDNYVERLIVGFDLNDCEAGDLCAFVDLLRRYVPTLTRDEVRTHARMRAEVLELVGSEMQEMYDDMDRWGKEKV